MKKIILAAALVAAMCFTFAACGGEKAADEETTNAEAMTIEVTPGKETVLEDGVYSALTLDASMSGKDGSPTVIRAADGAKPIIKVAPGEFQNGEQDELPPSYGIHLVNVHDVVIDGITVEGGTHGIIYESTRSQGEEPLTNITIKDCRVTGVVGVHGICVYAENDLAPVQDILISGCEVTGCKCGDSESLVLNGNIDGFMIRGNRIHDNNNIGIDMIGFEGTAKHRKDSGFDNLYDADMVRNGLCFDNIVFNISTDGNPAYYENGEYDLSADGIYVDGGQNIEVYGNFVYNCDIGIEVATEHSPDDNPLFKVSGVRIHDNVVADCRGWCGLCFGGYDADLGFTEGCEFFNNTFIDNDTQIGVQRSKGNSIHDNLFVGGNAAIEFTTDCRQEDLINDFGRNVWCLEEGSLEDMIDAGDYDLSVLLPAENLALQEVVSDRDQALEGLKSKIHGVGSTVIPEDSEIELWQEE